jgi:hypothetical protein
MTRSAPTTLDWNSNVIALLVIGSTRWFGSVMSSSLIASSPLSLAADLANLSSRTHPVNATTSRQMGGGNSLLMTQANHRRTAMLWSWRTARDIVGASAPQRTALETNVCTVVEMCPLLVNGVAVQEFDALVGRTHLAER